MMGVAEVRLQDGSPGMQHDEAGGIVTLWHVSLLCNPLVWWSNKVHVSHLEIRCATHGIPAPTEGACGMQTFFPANKAFLDIFISSTNMLFLGSTLCVMSMMVNSTKILIMLMDDWSSRMWVSALCIFFFFFLCDSWLGNGSSCVLEVVALSAGEKGGAYGSQDSHQMVSAQRKKETQTRENNGTEQYL